MVQNMGLDPLCFCIWVCEVQQEPIGRAGERKGWEEDGLHEGLRGGSLCCGWNSFGTVEKIKSSVPE